jgi:hypothetical protein
MLDPVIFGTSIWETFHSLTGLPWWASIPLATATIRALLLPLSLKAKAATVNFSLMQQASKTAGALLEQLKKQQEDLLEKGQSEPKRLPSRWSLSRQYYKYLRRQHQTTSIWWFNVNTFLQVSWDLFSTSSVLASLRGLHRRITSLHGKVQTF